MLTMQVAGSTAVRRPDLRPEFPMRLRLLLIFVLLILVSLIAIAAVTPDAPSSDYYQNISAL